MRRSGVRRTGHASHTLHLIYKDINLLAHSCLKRGDELPASTYLWTKGVASDCKIATFCRVIWPTARDCTTHALCSLFTDSSIVVHSLRDETPTVAAFSAAFVVEPRRRPAGATADGVHGREFVGNVAQHGIVTCKQLLDISVIRRRLAQTAGREQMSNLAAVNSPPAAHQSFSGRGCRVNGGQAAHDERVV